jgi:hypothetical protein
LYLDRLFSVSGIEYPYNSQEAITKSNDFGGPGGIGEKLDMLLDEKE